MRGARLHLLAAVLAFGSSSFGLAEGAEPTKDEPIKKIDRSRLVGDPVLDENAIEGVYVWLEEGWYNVAAVTNLPFGTKKKLTRPFAVRVSSTAPMKAELGAFKKLHGGDHDVALSVVVGPRPEKARFKSDGEITISAATVQGRAVPILLGPSAKRGASAVKIGRY